MNVLHILSSMDPQTGGVCQVIRNSVPAMNKKGIYNEVISFDSPTEDFINQDSFVLHAMGPAKKPYGYSSRFPAWLDDNLERFDTVIVHGLWQHNSYGTFQGLQRFKRKHGHRPQLYVMPHGMLDPYFQRAKSRKLKAIRNYFFWKLIEFRLVNEADGILFTCERELLLAREPFVPYRPGKELNIGYGIEHPPVFKEQFLLEFYMKCPAVKNRPYFLFLSRIHPKKGVDLLVQAYLKLKSEIQDIPDLVIAGPGMETSYGRSILKLCTNGSIHFPGMLMNNTKWGAFYGCEAFVLPSHQENFGIAVVEALACKKAVLISEQVNICREIQMGRGGIVAQDSEAGTYSSLKKWVSLSAGEKNEMKENAYRTYRDRYTIDTATNELIRVIRNTNFTSPIETKEHTHGIISHNLR